MNSEKVYILIAAGQSNSTCASSDAALCSAMNKSPFVDNIYSIGPQCYYKVIPAKNPLPNHTTFPFSVSHSFVVANELKKDLPPNSKIIIICAGFAGSSFSTQKKEWMENVNGKMTMMNHGSYSWDINFKPNQYDALLNPTPHPNDINLTFDMIKMIKMVQAQYPNNELLGMTFQQGESDIRNVKYRTQLLVFYNYVRKALDHIHLPISIGTPLKYWLDSAQDYGIQLMKTINSIPDLISEQRGRYYSFMKIANFDDVTDFNKEDRMNVHFLSSSQVNVLGPRHAQNLRELRTLLNTELLKYMNSLSVSLSTSKDLSFDEEKDKNLHVWAKDHFFPLEEHEENKNGNRDLLSVETVQEPLSEHFRPSTPSFLKD